MAKVLKLRAVNHPNFDKVIVRVVEQSHLGDKFGNNPNDLRLFIAGNGLILGSNSHPSLDAVHKQTQFWFQGNGPASKQDNSFVVSKATYEKLKDAVAEYNHYYSREEINKRVLAKRERELAEATEALRVATEAYNRCVRIVG